MNVRYLQWDLVAIVVHFFLEEMGSLICIMQHPSCNASSAAKYKVDKYELYFQSLDLVLKRMHFLFGLWAETM